MADPGTPLRADCTIAVILQHGRPSGGAKILTSSANRVSALVVMFEPTPASSISARAYRAGSGSSAVHACARSIFQPRYVVFFALAYGLISHLTLMNTFIKERVGASRMGACQAPQF